MNRSCLRILVCICIFSLSFKQSSTTKLVSFDFSSRILEKGKYVSVKGALYYHIADQRMTTRLTQPFENVTITDANGEMKIYDPKENSVVYSSSAANSIETSYFSHFFNNSTSDMGLKKLGYSILQSKIDDGMFVTSWVPKQSNEHVKRVELAHQKQNIMFMQVISAQNKPLAKIYFSKHTPVGSFTVPLNISEITYTAKGDSVITSKLYSNPKINGAVDMKFADYKIPKDAKIVKVK